MTDAGLAPALAATPIALLAGIAIGWVSRWRLRDYGLHAPCGPPPEAAAAGDDLPSETATPRARLAASRSWGYQLADIEPETAGASSYDILIVDPSRDGRDETSLAAAEVMRLGRKPEGSRRLVIASLSIGAAEVRRGYWQTEWVRQPPRWMLGGQGASADTRLVRFWDPAWLSLLLGSPDARLDRILAQGFDGVCLDNCDVAAALAVQPCSGAPADPETAMGALVAQIATYARARRPGFVVLLQNPERIIAHAALRAVIDGVMIEDLLYGLERDEHPNRDAEIRWTCARLDLVRAEGKPVLVVEYLDDPLRIAQARAAAHARGYLLHVADASGQLDRLRPPVAV
jgi:cysteinyl-tRNA synthetase, unknown class